LIARYFGHKAMLATWGCTTFPKPTIDLQFAGATSLDNRITFTRATTATYFNSSGVLSTAASGEARFDYNPTTLAPLGLLIEEARTNSLLQSQNFTTTWSAGNVTVTANTTTAPDGTSTAETFDDDVANGGHDVGQSIVTTTGTTYTLSAFLKNGNRQYAILACSGSANSYASAKFDLSAGTLGSTVASGAGWSFISSSITSVGSGWYRCTITFVVGTTTGNVARIGMATDGTTFTASQRGLEVYTGSDKTIFVWGAQLEAGAFATSYIPTTTTALTRNADVATMTGTNFSSWYNASEGTVFVSAQFTESVALKTIYEINDNTTANHLRATVNASVTTPIFQVSNVTAQAAITLGSAALNVFLMTNAYKVDDFSAALGGTLGTPDTSGSLPTVTQLTIGRRITDRYLNGYIQRIAYYPVRLANTTLQALTA
jgi:hypothetical protein